jgi:hypothetical protein
LLLTALAVLGEKDHRDAVVAGEGQLDVVPVVGTFEVAVWDLEEDPRAIAGARVAAFCAPVGETTKDFKSFSHHVV